MATQAERRDRTKKVIIDAATSLFIEQGFVATTVGDILAAAEVSRGALYHHFPSKDDVFEAVFIATSDQAIRHAKRRSRAGSSPLQTLVEGCLAWVDIATEPAVARIMFVEGPVALGWQRCRELEDEASSRVTRNGLAVAVDHGELNVQDVDLTAQLLNAVLAEAALAIHHGHKGASRAAAARSIRALIEGLAA